MDNLYLQTHLKLLLTEFSKAYIKRNFIELQQIKEKINNSIKSFRKFLLERKFNNL